MAPNFIKLQVVFNLGGGFAPMKFGELAYQTSIEYATAQLECCNRNA